MVRSTLLLLVLFCTTSLTAQQLPVGIVDINQHHLGINAAGMIGFPPNQQDPTAPHTNEVPAGSGIRSIYSGSPWFTTVVDDSTLAFADCFRGSTAGWMPGPVMTDQTTYQQEAQIWDRVWEVTRAEIEDHIAHYQDVGYSPIEVIENWPGNGDPSKGQSLQLAPFEDLDNDGVYEPMNGDYPLIRGDEAVYAIFNGHRQSQIANLPSLSPMPLQVEVHAMLYGFNCVQDEALDHALFLRYQIINRSNHSFEDSRFTQWVDADIGNPSDDYAACDVERSMFYFRNGDAHDEDGSEGQEGYGDSLGILGISFLKGAPLENDGIDNQIGIGNGQSPNGFGFEDGIIDNEAYGLEGFYYHKNEPGPMGDPYNTSSFFSLTMGEWLDQTPMTYGGNGYDPNNPNALAAKFMFPGATDPDHYGTNGINPANLGFSAAWTEEVAGNLPSDRRGLGTTGTFELDPGDDALIEMAIVFAQAPWGQDSLALTQAADHVKDLYLGGGFDCGNFWPLSVAEASLNEELQLYPNPAHDLVIIANGKDDIPWKILSQTGQIVKTGTGTRIDLTGLSNGVYFIEARHQGQAFHQKMIKE